MMSFKTQFETKLQQQEQKLASLNNRVTQFALGGGSISSIQATTPAPFDNEQRLLDHERKIAHLLSINGTDQENLVKKLKDQQKKLKEKTTADGNLLRELDMKFLSFQKSMPS